jgi:aldose 1-epimerase
MMLHSSCLEATLSPRNGGLIERLVWTAPNAQRFDLLYSPAGLVPSHAAPNRFGLWAMVPFANRAFGGVVDDGTQTFTVPINDPAANINIHGFGWQSDWSYRSDHAGHTVMTHRREAGPDPYRYQCDLDISLDAAGMTAKLSVTNTAQEALPFGIGLHPWFPCAEDTRLMLASRGALLLGQHYRATGHEAFSHGGPYAHGPVFRRDSEQVLSCLGWDGQATMITPSTGLRLTMSASETMRSPLVWAPANADFLCVEPQSHGTGSPSEAPAREVAPLTTLQPDETLSGWMRLVPSLLAS